MQPADCFEPREYKSHTVYPVFLGYRVRGIIDSDYGFLPRAMRVSSATTCMIHPTLPERLEEGFACLYLDMPPGVNCCEHFTSLRRAHAAARDAGLTEYEVHATVLYPISPDPEYFLSFQVSADALGAVDLGPILHPKYRAELGFDLVGLDFPNFSSGFEQTAEALEFSHSPMFCNSICEDEDVCGPVRVNDCCLIDTWEQVCEVGERLAPISEDLDDPYNFVCQIFRIETGS